MPPPPALRLYSLEDRTVPASATVDLEPAAVDSVVFDPGTSGFVLQSSITFDGRGDASAMGSDWWGNRVWNQAIGFIEFDLGPAGGAPPVGSSVIAYLPDCAGKASSSQVNRISVAWYIGDGRVTVADRNVSGSSLGTLTTRAASGGARYELDVTEAVRQLHLAGGRYLGLKFTPTQNNDFESFGVADSFNEDLIPYLRVPAEVAVTSVAWNMNRGVNRDAAQEQRGLTVTVTVDSPAPAAFDTQLQYYWSADSQLSADDVLAYSDRRTFPAGTSTVVEPARSWDASDGARYLLAVLHVAGTDQADAVFPLRVRTAAEILDGAVRVVVDPARPHDISAAFIPGSGTAENVSLSEAEVVLGVDHFNWLQTWRGPTHWFPFLWQDAWDPATRRKLFYVDEDPLEFRYEDGPRADQPVEVSLSSQTVADPVVQDEPGHHLTLVQEVAAPDGTHYTLIPFVIASDAAPYYHDETAWAAYSGDTGGTFSPREFELRDSPSVVAYGPSYLDADVRVYSYRNAGQAMAFNTRLVGVDDSGNTVELDGRNVGFTWRSNTVSVGGVVVGGAVHAKGSAAVGGTLAGGVFAVAYADGTPIPGAPTTAPALPAVALPPPPGSPPPSPASFPPSPSGDVRQFLVGGPADGSVRVVAPDGQSIAVSPFGNTGTPTRSTDTDVDGDTYPDLIAVTGPGTPLRVAVVSGATGAYLVAPFDPFGGNFTGGGYVATADLDGDGRAEFVVTPDQGGGPRVSIYSLNPNGTTIRRANFLGIDDAAFRGGARAALGDVNRDGTPDVIVAAGFGGGPRTAIFTGQSILAGNPTRLVADFFAFPGADATNLRNGSFVAAGDVTGDGFADLIFGGGPGGAPRVFVLSGAKVSAGNVAGAQANPVANFFVGGDLNDRGGARVATTNSDGDVRADLAVGSGAGRPARVRVYLGANLLGGEPGTFQDIAPFGGAVLTDGVFVG